MALIDAAAPAWAHRFAEQVTADIAQAMLGRIGTCTVSTLPKAVGVKRLMFVSDESGGAVLAFNDGTDWRRVTDRAVVS